VLKRFGHIMLAVALLAATGGHWAFLQSVAWTTMLSENLQTYGFTEAVQRTFNGQHPCRLCCQIKESRKTERQTPAVLELKKLEFVSVRPALVFAAPTQFRLVADYLPIGCEVSHEPPSPPPRPFCS
jgi:hypothetical protein